MRFVMALSLCALACGKDDTSGDATGDWSFTGTIRPDGETISGIIDGQGAFAFDQGGKLLVYISSHSDSTCENVTEYFSSSDPFDPVEVLAGGHCNMYLKIGEGYDGELSHAWDEDEEGIDIIGAGTSIECAMGDGEFALETRDTNDRDYYWSGRWWQGHPVTYSFDISGGGGDDYTLDIEMQSYNGGFIYEDFSNTPADGTVKGVVTAERCASLGSTSLFASK